jgi:adenylosuccinate synthase
MPSLVIVGAQWGDEGKGKIVDYLTAKAHWVARYQGGDNAGHTLVVDGHETKLNLIPSGILRSTCRCAIGAGVVLDGIRLLEEIAGLLTSGIKVTPERLIIDENVDLVLEYHRLIDSAREEYRGENKIGTTGRGIGPAYEDRAARCGLRLGELRDVKRSYNKIRENVDFKNRFLAHVLGSSRVIDFDEVWGAVQIIREKLLPYAGSVGEVLHESYKKDDCIIFEGAQGILLDQAFGTFPYVTSSHTTAGAVATGCGVGPRSVGTVVGIAKAYCTRVGEGPFPTEMPEPLGSDIRKRGREFGVRTGRPRRCGWLDLVALRYAVRTSGIDELILTKLDVLSGIPTLQVAKSYKEGTHFPNLATELSLQEPVYTHMEGWDGDLGSCRSWEALPVTVHRYLEAIADTVGCKVGVVSLGAERKTTLVAPSTSLHAFL